MLEENNWQDCLNQNFYELKTTVMTDLLLCNWNLGGPISFDETSCFCFFNRPLFFWELLTPDFCDKLFELFQICYEIYNLESTSD